MKRIIKAIVAVSLVLIILTGLSGCSVFDFLAAEDLLKPPKLTGEKAKLQLAFEAAVGTDIRLFTPVSGDYRGSYIIFDANQDGDDEAVVFYSFNSNSSVVHMHLLSQSSGNWYSIGDFAGSGTEVYKVDFYNVDDTKNLEIGVIWSLDDSKREKNLSIYRINSLDRKTENSLVSLATIQIADYVYCNVDDDASNELLYFYYGSQKGELSVNARLMDYDTHNESFVPISEVTLPRMFSSISQIISDKENNNVRFYVDCFQSGGILYSEMVVYNNDTGALFIPTAEDRHVSVLTERELDIYCNDFNNDGYLDIPVIIDSSDSYSITDADNLDISLMFSEWYTYLDDSFTSIGKYFINQFDGYALKIDTLYEQYFIVYDYVNKVTLIRLKESDYENDIIFSISVADHSDDLVNLLPDGLLGDKGDSDLKIEISVQGEMLGFSDNFVRSLITDL